MRRGPGAPIRLDFPFAHALVYPDRTRLVYYKDPVPLDPGRACACACACAFMRRRLGRGRGRASSASSIARYCDTLLLQRHYDETILSIARRRASAPLPPLSDAALAAARCSYECFVPANRLALSLT